MNNPELHFYLLKEIHKYYPAGMPTALHDYPGYQVLKNIIDAKFSEDPDVKNKNRQWAAVVEHINPDFPGVNNLYSNYLLRSPGYELQIFLPEYKQFHPYCEIKSRIFLNLSLLVPYFTVYVEDEFIFTSSIKNDRITMNDSYKIIYSGLIKEEISEKIENIKRLVAIHFAGYEFIAHPILFSIPIVGVMPYSDSFDKQHKNRIIHYLFSDTLQLNQFTVVED